MHANKTKTFQNMESSKPLNTTSSDARAHEQLTNANQMFATVSRVRVQTTLPLATQQDLETFPTVLPHGQAERPRLQVAIEAHGCLGLPGISSPAGRGWGVDLKKKRHPGRFTHSIIIIITTAAKDLPRDQRTPRSPHDHKTTQDYHPHC